ncbi:MAG: hypothetical protein U0821_26195 [Chloroflexota bacterium]
MKLAKAVAVGRLALAASLFTSSVLLLPSTGAWTVAADEINCEDPENTALPECAPPPPPEQPPAAENPPSEQPAPAARANDPWNIVFNIEDAGKEAYTVITEEGSDQCGRWARTRFERDRGLSSSKLGPNVIDTKAWVCKDVEAAKALFKTQSEVKNWPERKENVSGPNEKFKKLANAADQTFSISGYYSSNTTWRHYRIGVQKGQNFAILYLFGREDLFTEDKDKSENGLVNWFLLKYAGRL